MLSVLFAARSFLFFSFHPTAWSWVSVSVLFVVLKDQVYNIGRSDPTENDSVEGLRPNARGPGLVTFGVSSAPSPLLVVPANLPPLEEIWND